MPGDSMRYVVCYDVADDKRRRRLVKALDSYAARVQYSVFEAVLDHALLQAMMQALEPILEPAEDRLMVYPICAACAKRRVTLGMIPANGWPGEEFVFIA